MEKPDWDSITRMVHIQFGQWRWENSEKSRKRKIRSDSFNQELLVLSETEDRMDSVVTVNNLLPVGWDEPLLERLQPAEKRTNKRASLVDNNGLTFTQPQFIPIGCNNQQEFHRAQRAQSEDPLTEACARQRRKQYQDDKVHLTVEYDESEMSRRSSGDRKHRHSSSEADVIDLLKDSKLPPAEEAEDSGDSLVRLSAQDRARLLSKHSASPALIFDTANTQPQEIEDVGEVISARRVKEHSGKAELPRPTKSVSSGNAGTLRSGRLIHGSEETNATDQGNAHDEKDSNDSKVTTKEPWYA
jgi:hypothetical protein